MEEEITKAETDLERELALYQELLNMPEIGPVLTVLSENFPNVGFYIYGSVAEAKMLGYDVVEFLKAGVFSDIDSCVQLDIALGVEMNDVFTNSGFQTRSFLHDDVASRVRLYMPDFPSVVVAEMLPHIDITANSESPIFCLFIKSSEDFEERSRDLFPGSMIHVDFANKTARLETSLQDINVPVNEKGFQARLIRVIADALTVDDKVELDLQDQQLAREFYWAMQIPYRALKSAQKGLHFPFGILDRYVKPVYELIKTIRDSGSDDWGFPVKFSNRSKPYRLSKIF